MLSAPTKYGVKLDSTGHFWWESGFTLREKCPYSEFFWSVFSPNAGKYGPEKLRKRPLFTSC